MTELHGPIVQSEYIKDTDRDYNATCEYWYNHGNLIEYGYIYDNDNHIMRQIMQYENNEVVCLWKFNSDGTLRHMKFQNIMIRFIPEGELRSISIESIVKIGLNEFYTEQYIEKFYGNDFDYIFTKVNGKFHGLQRVYYPDYMTYFDEVYEHGHRLSHKRYRCGKPLFCEIFGKNGKRIQIICYDSGDDYENKGEMTLAEAEEKMKLHDIILYEEFDGDTKISTDKKSRSVNKQQSHIMMELLDKPDIDI